MLAALWDRPNGDVTYAVVPPAFVDPRVRHAAKLARAFAAAHLGASEPLTGFYRPVADVRAGVGTDWPTFRSQARRGHAAPESGSIGVRADLSPLAALETAAHEVFHLTQDSPLSDAAEAEADAYGAWAADVLTFCDGGRLRVARTVHAVDDSPWRCTTLNGSAEHGDILVARGLEGARVFRNIGWAQVEWVQHYRPCPVRA